MEKIRYCFLMLAFATHAMLFTLHHEFKTTVALLIHNLLVFNAYIGIAVTFGEMVYPDQLLFALGRACIMVFQGTWCYIIGYILYNPFPNPKKWDYESRESVMWCGLIYIWNVAFIIFTVALVSFVMGKIIVRKRALSKVPNVISSLDEEQRISLMCEYHDKA